MSRRRLSRTKLLGAVTMTAALTAVTARVEAQEPFGLEGPAPAPPAPDGTDQAAVARYWALGRLRWFAATIVEAGYAYARPRFTLGYGQPYWRWVGLETYPIASLSGLAYYAGIGGALPGLSLRAGGRYVYPFSRTLLPEQESYTRTDLDLQRGPKASYLALEAEAAFTVPILVGSAFLVLTGMRTELVDEGFRLYEESLRVVLEPPHVGRARLGYLFTLGRDGSIRVGPVGDAIVLPGRDELVVRGGVLAMVLINAHLDAQASLIPVLASPDSLGLAGGDFGQLGVRFRWATDSTPDPARVRREVERRRRETAE